MTEKIELGENAVTHIITDEEEYHHIEGKSLDMLVLDESEHPIIKGRDWICKACKLDNKGVICSECKKMYNPADPNCELKD